MPGAPRHGERRGLLKQRRPAPKTMADFRKNHLVPLRQVCRECTLWCQPLALCAGARVAIDGSHGKAVHAQARNCTPDKLPRLHQQSDQRVEGSLQALERGAHHAEAGTPGGAVADPGQAQLAALEHRQRL